MRNDPGILIVKEANSSHTKEYMVKPTSQSTVRWQAKGESRNDSIKYTGLRGRLYQNRHQKFK